MSHFQTHFPHGIKPLAIAVLMILRKPCTLRSLSVRLSEPLASVTDLVAELVKLGLVAACADRQYGLTWDGQGYILGGYTRIA